jgi:transposase
MTELRKAKTYTSEFRESAVQLALLSNRPMAQTAQELGLSKDTWYGWVRQTKAQRPVAPAPVDPVQVEWKRLRKENAQLRGERDTLKKQSTARAAAG